MILSHIVRGSVVLVSVVLGTMGTEIHSRTLDRPEITAEVLEHCKEWIQTGSFNAARQKLEEILPVARDRHERASVLFLLLQCDFKMHDYDRAYDRASEFVSRFPHDSRWTEAVYVRGVSAYHVGQCDTALQSLRLFLDRERRHPDRGSALYWKALCLLEHGEWALAEQDIRQCYEESTTAAYRDHALTAWALLFERRGRYAEAIERLQELLNNYPKSPLVNEARLRLASLHLRTNNPVRSLRLLSETKHGGQREEYLFFSAEASRLTKEYRKARTLYEQFIVEFPRSPFRRYAVFGLAWTLLQSGDNEGARLQLAQLAEGRDSLSFSASYQRAVLALLEGNIPEALSVFDSLVDRSPYDMFAERAYFQLGMIHYRSGRYSEARRHFQLAARLFPDNPYRAEAFRMFGEASLALRDFSNAHYGFAQARRTGLAGDDIAAAFFKEGIALYHLGRFKSSAERLSEFLTKYPGHHDAAEGYVWKAEALYQDGRYAEAERAYADALRLYPRNPKRADALYGLAWALFEQQQFSRAADAFDRFASEYPENDQTSEASLRKADCYFFLGQYDRANALYRAIGASAATGRNKEYAAFQIAMSFIQRGDAQRGIEQLRNFLVQFPQSVYNEVAQFNIGWSYFSNERYSEALEEFKVLMNEFPESQLLPRVLFNMGDAFYNLRMYDSARVYYQRVMREFPTSPLVTDALTGLQFAYQAEGKPAGALATIEQFLQMHPEAKDRQELLMRKGDLLFDQGDYAAALQEYRQVLTLRPDRSVQARVIQQIGRIYELENNIPRAAFYYAQVVSEFSDTEIAPAVTLNLGHLHFRNRLYGAALEVLREFLVRYPDSPLLPEVQFHIGMALAQSPNKQPAFDQFQTIIRRRPDDVFAERSRIQLARLLLERKAYQASIDTLEGVVSRRSDDLAAEALLVIGENYLSMKRPSDALQAFKDIIGQYHDYPLLVERAHLGAGESYERLKDRTKARASYEAVVSSGLDASIRKEAEDRLRRMGR